MGVFRLLRALRSKGSSSFMGPGERWKGRMRGKGSEWKYWVCWGKVSLQGENVSKHKAASAEASYENLCPRLQIKKLQNKGAYRYKYVKERDWPVKGANPWLQLHSKAAMSYWLCKKTEVVRPWNRVCLAFWKIDKEASVWLGQSKWREDVCKVPGYIRLHRSREGLGYSSQCDGKGFGYNFQNDEKSSETFGQECYTIWDAFLRINWA